MNLNQLKNRSALEITRLKAECSIFWQKFSWEVTFHFPHETLDERYDGLTVATNSKKSRLPGGIPYIVGNEAAERFSYYGMRSILVIFLTKYVVDSAGAPDYLSDRQATEWFHYWSSAVYFFPIIGALISDILWGKYKTILRLSIVYCIGHLCLAMFETRMGFAVGLALIAVGSGGIKPCVSAHVGDQFDRSNQDLLDKTFGWFYFAINLGAASSIATTPYLLENYGPGWAFGVPGILMFIATVVFWFGRNSFVHVPPAGLQKVKEDIFSPEGLRALGSLAVIYFFIAFFWALYDQSGSSWVLQADKLDRIVSINLGFFQSTFEVLPSQVQAINPILIMIFVPLFYNVLFPFVDKYYRVTPLRKMTVGFAMTGMAFAVVAVTEQWLEAGLVPSMGWQLLAFVIITAAEVLISTTALEFSYTQAPNSIKSIVMGLFFLSVSLGNLITAGVNTMVQNPDGSSRITGSEYFWFFVILVLVAGVLFGIFSKFYQPKSYIQPSLPDS